MSDHEELRYPEDWENADLVWERFQKRLPSNVPIHLREKIEQDVFALVRRWLDGPQPKIDFSFQGPDELGKILQGLATAFMTQVAILKGQVLSELMTLRAQLAAVEAALDRLEGEGHHDA